MSRVPKMLKPSRSYNSLLDREKSNTVNKKLTKAKRSWSQHLVEKARRVSFYKNGDYFYSGVHVPIQKGKHFHSMAHLCDYLTQKTKLPQGVRYIFTENGEIISSMDEFEDGKYYVVSSTKQFESLPYGQFSRGRTAHTSKPLPVREEDLRLFRPVSPVRKKMDIREPIITLQGAGSYSQQPGSRENRIITVVRNSDHATRSSVLLNLRTSQPFEDVLEDLGQAIKLRKVRKMLTPLGHEVRSFSQLKNEFRDVETFFLEGEDRRTRDAPRVSPYREDPPESPLISRSYSSPTLIAKDDKPPEVAKEYPNRYAGSNVNVNGSEKQNPGNYPLKKLKLDWIHGYRGGPPGNNLLLLPSGELIYTVGAVVVLYHKKKDQQRHYTQHTEDILCICIHPTEIIVATGQGTGTSERSQPQVHLWDSDDLKNITVVGKNQLDGDVISLAFSPEGDLMLTLEVGKEDAIALWDWQSDSMVGRAHTAGDQLTGCVFHPYEENLILTFGMHHLAFWRRAKDGFMERKDALSPGHSGRTITSWAFLPDGSFVIGDSSGYITVWARNEDEKNGFFIVKELKAHESDVGALLLLPGGTLLSGGSADREGQVRAWDTQNKLIRMAMATLPPGPGGVRALCPQKKHSSDGNIYVGTNYNVILEGSVHRKFRPIVQGHRQEVLDLAVDPDETTFVTVDQDNSIYKWNLKYMIWDVKLKNECISLAVYPRGSAIVAGGSNGKLVVLNSDNGLVVATVAIASSSLSVLSYSSDGGMLAIGSQEGNVHLYHTQNHGYMYKKFKVLKGETPILNIDWSTDDTALQCVTSDNEYHELVLWNISNEKRLKSVSSNALDWHHHTCTLGHKITGIWENVPFKNVVYITCHKTRNGKFLATGDKDGFIRLFRYPCMENDDVKYYEYKHSTFPVTSTRFLSGNRYLVSVGGLDGAIFIWKLV